MSGTRGRPSARLRAPPAGTAPAPLQGSSREAPLPEQGEGGVTILVTNVKGRVADNATFLNKVQQCFGQSDAPHGPTPRTFVRVPSPCRGGLRGAAALARWETTRRSRTALSLCGRGPHRCFIFSKAPCETGGRCGGCKATGAKPPERGASARYAGIDVSVELLFVAETKDSLLLISFSYGAYIANETVGLQTRKGQHSAAKQRRKSLGFLRAQPRTRLSRRLGSRACIWFASIGIRMRIFCPNTACSN
jgi:hypothetical protein